MARNLEEAELILSVVMREIIKGMQTLSCLEKTELIFLLRKEQKWLYHWRWKQKSWNPGRKLTTYAQLSVEIWVSILHIKDINEKPTVKLGKWSRLLRNNTRLKFSQSRSLSRTTTSFFYTELAYGWSDENQERQGTVHLMKIWRMRFSSICRVVLEEAVLSISFFFHTISGTRTKRANEMGPEMKRVEASGLKRHIHYNNDKTTGTALVRFMNKNWQHH